MRGYGWILVAVVAAGAAALAQGQPPKTPEVREASDLATLREFQQGINDYLGLRKTIGTELPPLRVTPNAAEINERSEAIARAVERGRPQARQGSVFTPRIVNLMRRQLEFALRSTDRAAILALVAEEEELVANPSVHMRFPAGRILATTPAVLLHALPTLPRELEYRFNGRTLILRDIEAALIVDFIPQALPAK
jgi:hypothetical protein